MRIISPLPAGPWRFALLPLALAACAAPGQAQMAAAPSAPVATYADLASLSEAGTVIARTDFYWDEIRLTAEFDGLAKYTGRLARPGAGGPVGQDALIREKHREDAVRRQGYGMVRWVWADLFNRRRFEAVLEQHGVPRRRR